MLLDTQKWIFLCFIHKFLSCSLCKREHITSASSAGLFDRQRLERLKPFCRTFIRCHIRVVSIIVYNYCMEKNQKLNTMRKFPWQIFACWFFMESFFIATEKKKKKSSVRAGAMRKLNWSQFCDERTANDWEKMEWKKYIAAFACMRMKSLNSKVESTRRANNKWKIHFIFSRKLDFSWIDVVEPWILIKFNRLRKWQ